MNSPFQLLAPNPCARDCDHDEHCRDDGECFRYGRVSMMNTLPYYVNRDPLDARKKRSECGDGVRQNAHACVSARGQPSPQALQLQQENGR